jgi:hypothetical protein
MCVVISPHSSAGMVSLVWCQIVKLSPAPNDTFAQSNLKLFYNDSFSRSYGIQTLLRCREILECVQNLISPCTQASAQMPPRGIYSDVTLPFPLIFSGTFFGLVSGFFQASAQMPPRDLRVVPPGKRLRVPSCTRPEILGSG